MANYRNFMVSERRLLTDDSERVRTVLAGFGVGEDDDDGLYFDAQGPGTCWLGGYAPTTRSAAPATTCSTNAEMTG